MNIDGQIAEIVLRWFIRKGIPVLSVHDSFIVPYTHVAELKRVMGLAAKRVVGRALSVDASGPGLDEIGGGNDVRLDFQSWRQTPRGDGYLARLRGWEERRGREVVPYVLGDN